MSAPPVLVVEHAADTPAADCAVAGALAGPLADGLDTTMTLLRLRDSDAAFPQAGAAEHVLAAGRLADNALFWIERAMGPRVRHVEAADLPDTGSGPLVVAYNPILAPRQAAADLNRRVDQAGPQGLWLRAAADGDGVAVSLVQDGTASPCVARGDRDRYGRWMLRDAGLDALWAERFGLPAPPAPTASPARDTEPAAKLVVVGETAHLRDVFPAVLAALGDAADETGTVAAVDVVSPRGLNRAAWQACLDSADGLVLPGGSDLDQVAGQVQAASLAMASGLPTLGLCLGMQTMSVAAARTPAAGLPDANLEEVDPAGPCHLFRRLTNERGEPRHRLGAAEVCPVPGTRLAAYCGAATRLERLNHRYALAETLVPALEAGGLRVCARSVDGAIVDGVEIPEHPFFVGLQCHPELSSRPAVPHPLVRGFLQAAVAHRRGAVAA